MRTSLRIAVFTIFVYLGIVEGLFGQALPSIPMPKSNVPESGFLCPEKYTNAFFGFSLPLPKNLALKVFSDSLKGPAMSQFLISFASADGKNTLVIAARSLGVDAKHDVRDEAAGPQELKTKQIQIGGEIFWRSESKKKNGAGEFQSLTFATERNRYVLAFYIVSFDPRFTIELERSVDSLAFFEATQTQAQLEAGCKVYNPFLLESSSRISRLSDGVVANNAYYNSELGFNYQIPDGWTINETPSQKRYGDATHPFIWRSPFSDAAHATGVQCTKNLFLATQYAEGIRLNRFNPVVLLTVADPECAPGVRFPRSMEDREAVQRIAGNIAGYFKTPVMNAMGPATVRPFINAGRVMLEISQPFSLLVETPDRAATYYLHTSLLLMQAGDYWVIWVFASDKEAQLDELRATKIIFHDTPAGPINP